MSKNRLGLVGLLILLILVVAVARFALQRGSIFGARAGTGLGDLEASGVISADEITLSSTHGGKVAAFYVMEGDSVKAGQRLVVLDTTLLEVQIAVAEAQLAVAQAGLQQVVSGARPGAIAVAEARLAQAKAAHQAAVQALVDAQTLRHNPQELDMQIAVGEIQVEAARYRLESAVELKNAAEVGKNVMEYMQDQIRDWPYPIPPPKVPQELESAPYDWWQAWVGVNMASAKLDEAKALLAHWRSVHDDPQDLKAQVDMAQAAAAQAAAAVDAAQAQLDACKAGAREEQLAAARAQVTQAQAALDALQAELEEMVVVAPVDGIVLSRATHAGEVVMPGSKLLSLADLTQVKLTVYIPENRLGEVSLNQKVSVTVDAFPGHIFEGQVRHIADHAQYTPRNVATKEERVNTVYAVEVILPNLEGLLKPGMPADAKFVRGETTLDRLKNGEAPVARAAWCVLRELTSNAKHAIQG